jgi:enamine deaminase RidA (YjgF/YER057c/UK114 family)
MAHITQLDPKVAWDDSTPLTQGVKVGNLIYLSGQVALDSEGNVVGKGDLVAQTRKCFENIRDVLQLAGASLSDLVKLTTYFTVDIADPAVTRAYWNVREQFLGSHKPASTGLRVNSLIDPELLLEIDAVAVLPGK